MLIILYKDLQHSHLERIFVFTGNGEVTAYSLYTLNPGKFNAALLNWLFLKHHQNFTFIIYYFSSTN